MDSDVSVHYSNNMECNTVLISITKRMLLNAGLTGFNQVPGKMI